jgi:hypothetical protein
MVVEKAPNETALFWRRGRRYREQPSAMLLGIA